MRLRHNYRFDIARKSTTFFLQYQYPVASCVEPSLVAWQQDASSRYFRSRKSSVACASIATLPRTRSTLHQRDRSEQPCRIQDVCFIKRNQCGYPSQAQFLVVCRKLGKSRLTLSPVVRLPSSTQIQATVLPLHCCAFPRQTDTIRRHRWNLGVA